MTNKGIPTMLNILFLPIPSHWYLGFLWGFLTSVPAVLLARSKNRSRTGWALLCALTSFFFGILGFAWLVFLATRPKLSMRMKYLSLKLEERIADALDLPSPIRDNLGERVLMVLAYNPQGLRIGALAQGIGQNWRHIENIVQHLLSEGKIRREEDRYLFNLD